MFCQDVVKGLPLSSGLFADAPGAEQPDQMGDTNAHLENTTASCVSIPLLTQFRWM